MRHPDLARMLGACAEAVPAKGLRYYEDDGTQTMWTFAELDARARTLAAALEARGARGERVLLVYPQGLEFVAALFGCFYAGAIAVPAHPPNPMRLNRTLPRFIGLIADAKPRILATNALVASFGDALRAEQPALAAVEWLTTDAIPTDPAARPGAARDPIAMLQYTSGSTASPKGVILTHDNLLTNSAVIAERTESTPDMLMASWLPFQHDMGLIGGLLQMIYCHGSGVYCSPHAFLSRPALWPELVSRHRATITGAPNFAFDLAARRTPDDVLETLDLGSLRTLYCGAEPIREATLQRFAARFAPRGLAVTALTPCYGLAEGTLLVSFERCGVGLTTLALDADRLDRGEVVAADDDTRRRAALVASGPCGEAVEVAIVDPQLRERCAPDRVGEIWTSSGSVSPGYHGQPELSQEIMHERLDGSDGRWLRTGDLGFMRDGRLFVTGRLKDLIILQGRNVYPQDVERAAEESHRAVRPGCSVAFGLEVADQERVAVVAEVDVARGDPVEVARAIRRAVQTTQEITVQTVVLVKPGTLAKTSSGKVQRRATRAALLAGELDELTRAVYAHDAADAPKTGLVDAELKAQLLRAPPAERRRLLEQRIVAQVQALLPPDERAEVARDRGFFDLGLGSLAIADLTAELELLLGRPLAASTLFDHPNAARLAAFLVGADADAPPDALDELLSDLETMSDDDVSKGLGKG